MILMIADVANREVIALANAMSAAEELGVVVIENELALDNEGWALLAPFGEHRKSRMIEREGRVQEEVFVQVFDEASVDAILANEMGEGLFARLKRALIKRPIYNGHPDLKLYAPETVSLGNESLMPLGVNDGCRKSARGLEFKPLLVPAGAKAVEEEGCKFPSGLFLLKKTGVVREDGAIEVRPFKLASIGLTRHPNISGVDSLANARLNTPAATKRGLDPQEEAQLNNKQKDEAMKQLLIGWLAAQGVALANESTEQSVFEAFLKEMGTRSTSLAALGNEKSTLSGSVSSLTAERDSEKARADQAVTALANEQSALKAERQARCEAVVDLVIAQGRMDVASRDGKVTELVGLGNDKLPGAIEELGKLPVKFALRAATVEQHRKAEANPKPAAVALANEIEVLVKAGKSKGQALDQVLKEKPEVYRAYIEQGGGAI
jgi:hypothetical protein